VNSFPQKPVTRPLALRWQRLFVLVLLSAIGLVQAAPVRQVEGIAEYQLENGLQVLLVPDDSKPTTTVNVTYRVGSRHENYGETGMAHLLEHLLFKGSPRFPAPWSEFSKRGLRANGSTSVDRTNYFASFSADEDNLRWYLSWAADAMVNCKVAKADLDSEMTVVRNEMERGENNAFNVLYEKTLATMYQWHNYGKSTIGARADVEGVAIERLRAFYQLYYQPDNATLIVSGKFDPAATLRHIQAEFGAIPKPTRALPAHYTLDPTQEGERQVSLRRRGGVPLLLAAYHIPAGADPDYAAFELIDLLMSDDPAGRLHQRLVGSKLAASVFAFARATFDPGMVAFGAQLAPGQDVDAAHAAMLDAIESVAAQPFSAAELERARANWLIGWDRRFTDPEQIGVALSEYVALGDWRLFFLLRDRVKQIQLADVNRVASQWLRRDNRTAGRYLPTEEPLRAPAPRAVDLKAQLAGFKAIEAGAAVAAFDATPQNIDRLTRRLEIPPGIKLALLNKPTRGDVVDATLVLRMGTPESLRGRRAAGQLLPSLLDKGTSALSRQQVQDRQTELKSTISISGNAEAIVVNLQSTQTHLPALIELLGQLLRDPLLPADALEEARAQALASLEEARKEPQALVANTLERYGNPYPSDDIRYARSFDESMADLRSVDLAQIRALHRDLLGASAAQFSAVGAFDEAALARALTTAFAGWSSKIRFERVPRPFVPLQATRIVLETPDKQNATLALRLPLPLRELDADHAALLLANYVVGGAQNSRLWTRIREQEGLSYSVRTQITFNPFEPASMLGGSIIFAPTNRAKVEQVLAEELERVGRDGFSAGEIAQAKQGLLKLRELGRAQAPQLSGALARNAYLGRTFAAEAQLDAALERVTPAQALAAWQRYVDPARLVRVLGGDFEGRSNPTRPASSSPSP